MLLKLIKQDIKSASKFYIIVFILAAVCAYVGKITSTFYYGTPIANLLFLLNIIIMFGSIFGGVAYLLFKYYKTITSSAGYFSFMLPISSKKLLASKILSSYMLLLLSLIVNGGLFWYSLNELTRSQFIQFFQIADFFIGVHASIYVVIGLIISFTINILLGLMSGYLCITIGQTFEKHKAAISIALYIAVHIAINWLKILIIIAITTLMLNAPVGIAMAADFAFETIYNLVLCIISFTSASYILKKKLNLN